MQTKKQVFIKLDTWTLNMNELHEVISYLQGVLKSIPKEYRKDATFEATLFEEYGSPAVEYEVMYSRPFTEEEIASAKKREESRARLRKHQLLAELAELEANDPDRSE